MIQIDAGQPTKPSSVCGYSSMVEFLVAIENVARSNRVIRSNIAFHQRIMVYLKMERWQSGSMHRF